MDIDELHRRQAWNLDQKIDHSIATIENFMAKTGHNCYVSFSGGKDSTILLFIARKWIDKRMPAVFLDTGNEYPEICKYVRKFENVTILHPHTNMVKIIQENGFPLVSKDVSKKVRDLKHTHSAKLRDIRLHGRPGSANKSGRCPVKWQNLAYMPFDISEKCCDLLKKKRFIEYEKETGLYPLIGVTAAESRLRTMEYIRRGGCSAFTGPRPRSFPISIWTEDDIKAMAKRFNIELCPIYNDIEVRQTGCMVCGYGADQNPAHWSYLYKHYPAVYRHMMNITNNGHTYREALLIAGATLPDAQ